MLETLVEVVNVMQQQMNSMQQEMNTRFEDVRLQLMSADVRLDRLESMEHKALSIAYDVRADVRVMREETNAWSKGVMALKV